MSPAPCTHTGKESLPVSVSIPADLMVKLAEHKAETGEGRSALVNRLLREFFRSAA